MATGDIINTTVQGTDGETPIYDPNGRFQIWNRAEIYMGGPGLNRFVPKINDVVKDLDLGGLEYRVVGLDQATLIPQLQELSRPNSSGDIDDDQLTNVGPGPDSMAYRVYIDRSVVPYAAAVDAGCRIHGTMASYVRVFRGADLTDDGDIISHVYDGAGNIIGNRVPLELVQMASGVNKAVWAIPSFKTMDEIPDGERLTVIAYKDDGHVVWKRQLLAENTSFIRGSNVGTKYITGISLECPFLSATDPERIDLPVNVLLQGLNMVGVVNYSDGSKTRLPVDGSKFTMLGLDKFVASVVGQEAPLVLRYSLSQGEIFYGGSVGQFAHISKPFTVKTQQRDGSYSVKLFGYPVWLDAINGYTLRWYLYNGDRNTVYDVTGYVEFDTQSPAFNPLAYGVNQRLLVAINLKNVNGALRDYRHVQTIDFILRGPGTDRTTNWTVGFDLNQNPPYGVNNYARLEFVNHNLYRLNLSMGLTSREEWLNRVYYATKPLIDPTKEVTPPEPTHYRLRFGNQNLEFSIDQWNVTTQITNGMEVNGTVFIEFIRRLPGNDLQLGVSGLPLYEP